MTKSYEGPVPIGVAAARVIARLARMKGYHAEQDPLGLAPDNDPGGSRDD